MASQRGNAGQRHAALLVVRATQAEVFEFGKSVGAEEIPCGRFTPKHPLRYLYRNFPYYLWGARDGYPIPQADVIYLVTPANDIRSFMEEGAGAVAAMLTMLERHGVKKEHLKSILDFGCGCGRVLRFFSTLKLPWLELHGSDYNPKLIAWCNANLPFAKFEVNRLCPPLPYARSKFDFVYALSVFTHMPVPLQYQWMEEMARILKPRTYLLITTHGEAYLDHLSEAEKEQFRAGLVVVREEEKAGTNTCNAYHPPSFVKQHLAKGFEIIELSEKGQDFYFMRKL